MKTAKRFEIRNSSYPNRFATKDIANFNKGGRFFFQIFVAFSKYLNFKDKRVFFFLGKPLNNTKQKEIASENSKYGDIVQAGENTIQPVSLSKVSN